MGRLLVTPFVAPFPKFGRLLSKSSEVPFVAPFVLLLITPFGYTHAVRPTLPLIIVVSLKLSMSSEVATRYRV